MSRIRPPLTTSMTSPVTTSPALNFSSTEIQARSYSARFLERMRRPSLSSFWRTRASILSPRLTMSDGSASLRMDSSRAGMTPSLLKPMSTSTSSCSSLTTVPSTRSPSSNSVSVPSIISFICSSEMSEKSITEVFLISVKTDPFQKLNQGPFVMMVDTYHVRLQKQGSRCNKHVSGANRYLHLPPIGKPAQYSTARARFIVNFPRVPTFFAARPQGGQEEPSARRRRPTKAAARPSGRAPRYAPHR